jgi:hypothetical protein
MLQITSSRALYFKRAAQRRAVKPCASARVRPPRSTTVIAATPIDGDSVRIHHVPAVRCGPDAGMTAAVEVMFARGALEPTSNAT